MAITVRGALAAVASVGVLSLGALLAPHAAPHAVAAPRWAPAADAAIRPGATTDTAGGGICTSNFVFTSGTTTYLGQAAHCAGTGEATETDGCTSATGPVGTPVEIAAADGTTRVGTLAYSSWVTMQARGETDADTCALNDFALVALADGDASDVNPSVPFFGGPVGLRTAGLPAGEPVFAYGNSPLRLGFAALRPKAGVSAGDEGGGRGHIVYTITPGIPGDSGSAFLDSTGRATGLLSTLNLAPEPASNGVADLARALAYANAHGGLGDVELVPGTEPFTAEPPGVPPDLLAAPAGPPLGS